MGTEAMSLQRSAISFFSPFSAFYEAKR
ncbi:protein of unknown function [Candidatus Methylomirabilis oxygeniifera]|uniref:Uncharacterized protein n=1 Tax=Methylomirabilis oxygeniifera TaxID=671143 RepID=D5MMJ0_METO1|nr:protein of unknown function [Candidatus Methylomirabilis oxyfera]